MILIADSGSTKANWCFVINKDRKVHFDTEGYNPYFVDKDYIISSLLSKLPEEIPVDEVKEVNFYGAGCESEKADIVREALATVFKYAEIHVEFDMLAAARALLKTQKGFVAILGTGSNTCIYDGQDITANIDPLGFTLGDEGSGGYLGKKLLSDYLREYLPKELQLLFQQKYSQSKAEIMHHIYSMPAPNSYCANFSKFLYETIDHPYSQDLVYNAFREFFERIVCHYPDYSTYSLNCIGSIGFTFNEILKKVSAEYGMEVGAILQNPIDALIDFHIQHMNSANN
jgi:glucosamine kinase